MKLTCKTIILSQLHAQNMYWNTYIQYRPHTFFSGIKHPLNDTFFVWCIPWITIRVLDNASRTSPSITGGREGKANVITKLKKNRIWLGRDCGDRAYLTRPVRHVRWAKLGLPRMARRAPGVTKFLRLVIVIIHRSYARSVVGTRRSGMHRLGGASFMVTLTEKTCRDGTCRNASPCHRLYCT